MDHLAKSRGLYAMDGLRLACANNKFIWYARVSWVQARSRLMQYPRYETPACCRFSRAFYVLQWPYPDTFFRVSVFGTIRTDASFLFHHVAPSRNTNHCINLALSRRAIVVVLIYSFHLIVFSFLVTRPGVFPSSLSPHPHNLYFCYYWKSFLPGTRWKFISEQSLTLSLSLSLYPLLLQSPPLFAFPFLSVLPSFFSVFHSRHRFPRSWNFCVINCALSY